MIFTYLINEKKKEYNNQKLRDHANLFLNLDTFP